MAHEVIYLNHTGGSGRPSQTLERKLNWLRNKQYRPENSYEVALAGGQCQVYPETLKELGFKLGLKSINPNTDRPIHTWFKDATE